MSQFLSLWWDWGMASSEVIATTLLTFFMLTSNLKFKTKRFIKPAMFALSGLISVVIGWGIGNTINPGGATSFMLLPIVLVKSVYYQKYTALLMIVSMQLLGILLGYFIYRFFVFTTNLNIAKADEKVNYEQGLVRLEGSYKFNASKETIAQFIFALALVFMTIWSEYLNISSPFIMMLLNLFVLVLMLFVLLILFEEMNYFMLSPLFFLPTIISLKATKKEYINLIMISAIQIVMIMSMSNIEFAIRKVK